MTGRGVALRAAAAANPDGIELSHDVPLTAEARLAALVGAELDRCEGLLFTATARTDLVEVARWQLLADQAWCGQLRSIVAATCRMSAVERDFAGDELALATNQSPEAGRALVWFAGQVAALPDQHRARQQQQQARDGEHHRPARAQGDAHLLPQPEPLGDGVVEQPAQPLQLVATGQGGQGQEGPPGRAPREQHRPPARPRRRSRWPPPRHGARRHVRLR